MEVDAATQELIRQALAEDRTDRDVSTLWTVPAELSTTAVLWARQAGVLCGSSLFTAVLKTFDPELIVDFLLEEGAALVPNREVARISGRARSILTAERTALNLIGRLSGIATLTSRYVAEVVPGPQGRCTRIIETRKTTPLWRKWEKYAVRVGGGSNHRENLAVMVLLKDNHVVLAGGVVPTLQRVREQNLENLPVEVEVDRLDQLAELLAVGVDRVLLDNMSLTDIRKAVEMTAGQAELEVSGGVTLEKIAEIAQTGVDYISVGALTHSVPCYDFSLEIDCTTSVLGKASR
jgi:nicotinate-nucleotide pyrophosphorylase (carboxylating)